MKRRSIPILCVVLLGALLGASCNRNSRGITASGTIEATEVNVGSKVGGEVLEIAVGEGSRVQKGQALALIDHSTLDLQLAQAKAGVSMAEAQLQLLLKGARIEDIQQAQEGLTQAEENLRLAKEDAERMKDLFASGSATLKQRDDAAARYVVSQAQYNSAAQALKKIENLARPEEVQSAKAKLDQAAIAVQLLEKSIRDATITSPLDALVTQKLVETGELVSPGSTVFVLADLSRVELEVYVEEPDLSKISLGQTVDVRIDGPPPNAFSGLVSYISSVAEFTPKNIQTREERVKLVFGVKIQIDNPQGTLKPGMPADAAIGL